MNKNVYIKSLKALQDILKEEETDGLTADEVKERFERYKGAGKEVIKIGDNNLIRGFTDTVEEHVKGVIKKEKKKFFKKTSDLYESWEDSTDMGQVIKKTKELANAVEDYGPAVVQTASDWLDAAPKIIYSIIAYVGVKKLWKKIDLFGKYAIEDTKFSIDLAMNAKDYSQFSKCMKTLKNIQEKKWFKIASYNSDAVKMASNFISDIKTGYIALGTALILTSAILCLALGLFTKPFADIIRAIQEKNFKLVLQALGKFASIGILILPAIFGIILIIVASFNFEENNQGAELIKKLGPINKQLANTTLLIGRFANDLIKKIRVS